MDKKDIYEHLAKIYLDASSKGKKKHKQPQKFKKIWWLAVAVIPAFTVLVFFASQNKNKPSFGSGLAFNSTIALVLQPDIVKINFNFGPVRQEAYSVALNGLNLSKFKFLNFLIRKARYEDDIVLKVRFTNAQNQSAEYYIHNLPVHKWQEEKIPFADFKEIADWSSMSGISFVVEDSSTRQKNGVVYIDNVRFIR